MRLRVLKEFEESHSRMGLKNGDLRWTSGDKGSTILDNGDLPRETRRSDLRMMA